MKYGDDIAISMGGALPGAVMNGLPAIYDRLCKTADTVFVLAALRTDYVKQYPAGDKPDEPVLKFLRIEVAEGRDEATVLEMIDRIQSHRTNDPTLAHAMHSDDPEGDELGTLLGEIAALGGTGSEPDDGDPDDRGNDADGGTPASPLRSVPTDDIEDD